MRIKHLFVAMIAIVTLAGPVYAESSDPNDRILRGMISEALSRNDYKRARELAVTEAHFRMITDARDERRQQRQANRPIMCNSYKYTDKATQTVCN